MTRTAVVPDFSGLVVKPDLAGFVIERVDGTTEVGVMHWDWHYEVTHTPCQQTTVCAPGLDLLAQPWCVSAITRNHQCGGQSSWYLADDEPKQLSLFSTGGRDA